MSYHIRHRGPGVLGYTSDRQLFDVLTETGELVSTHRTRSDAEHKRDHLNSNQQQLQTLNRIQENA